MTIPYRWDEYSSAVIALIWAVVLILPGDLFSGIARYRVMADYAPDTLWGLFFAIGGILLFFPISLWLRKVCHALLCSIWLGIVILSLLANLTIGTALIASLCFFICGFHASQYFRLGHVT